MKNQDIHHSKIYLLSNVLTLLGYLILYPFVTKYISPSIYGDYILIYSYASIIIGIGNLGCRVGYRRNFFDFSDDRNYSKSLLFSVQIFILVIFVFIFSIFFFLEDYLLNFFSISEEVKSILFVILISLMLDSYCKYFLIYLENKKKSKKYFIIFSIKTYLYFAIVFFLIFIGEGITSMAYGLLLSNLFLLVVTTFIQFSKGFSGYNFNLNYLKEILVISIPSTPRIFFGRINSDIDKILISYFVNTESTGIYAIGQSIAYSIFQVMTSLDKVFVPEIYKMMFIKKYKEIGNYLSPFFFFLSLLTLGIISSANIIVDIFLDAKYAEAKIIIIIFSIYYLTLFFSKVTGHQLVFLKKVWVNTFAFFLNIFLNSILSVLLIYYFGFYGAAYATVISSLLGLFFSNILLKKWININYNYRLIISSYIFLTLAILVQIFVESSKLNSNYTFQFVLIILTGLAFIIYGSVEKIINKENLIDMLNINK